MEPGKLDALPIQTFRHILKLFRDRLISDTVPLVVSYEGTVWDDALFDEEGHSVDEVFEDITNKLESFGKWSNTKNSGSFKCIHTYASKNTVH